MNIKIKQNKITAAIIKIINNPELFFHSTVGKHFKVSIEKYVSSSLL